MSPVSEVSLQERRDLNLAKRQREALRCELSLWRAVVKEARSELK